MANVHDEVTRHPDLAALRRHAEYGHLEGQDYDAILALCDQVDEANRAALAWQAGSRQAWAEAKRLRAAITEHRSNWSTKSRPKCVCPASDPEEPWHVGTANECPWHGDDEYRVQVPGPRESNARLWSVLDGPTDA